MIRHGDQDLFFALMIALHAEHNRSVGHEPFASPRPLSCVTCETCMYLRMVSDELEARHYDGMGPADEQADGRGAVRASVRGDR